MMSENFAESRRYAMLRFANTKAVRDSMFSGATLSTMCCRIRCGTLSRSANRFIRKLQTPFGSKNDCPISVKITKCIDFRVFERSMPVGTGSLLRRRIYFTLCASTMLHNAIIKAVDARMHQRPCCFYNSSLQACCKAASCWRYSSA